MPAVFIWCGFMKARLNRRTTSRTNGEPVRIPTKNTTPIVTSTSARPTMSVAINLHMATLPSSSPLESLARRAPLSTGSKDMPSEGPQWVPEIESVFRRDLAHAGLGTRCRVAA